MRNLYIKRADITDIEDVIAIESECFDHRWSDNVIFTELINADSCYFLMYEMKEVVGFGGYQNIVGEAHIMTVAIKENRRNRGYGKILLSVMFDHIRKSGINAVTLEVRESNAAAISLYEKMGFEKSGIRKNYYSDNHENAIIMWRRDNDEKKINK